MLRAGASRGGTAHPLPCQQHGRPVMPARLRAPQPRCAALIPWASWRGEIEGRIAHAAHRAQLCLLPGCDYWEAEPMPHMNCMLLVSADMWSACNIASSFFLPGSPISNKAVSCLLVAEGGKPAHKEHCIPNPDPCVAKSLRSKELSASRRSAVTPALL